MQVMHDLAPHYSNVVLSGNLAMLRYLEEKVTEETLQEMIAYNNFFAYRNNTDFLDVQLHLENKASLQTLQSMMASYDFGVFQNAVRDDCYLMINHLLGYSAVFAYAETHVWEYSQYVDAFLTKKLRLLRAEIFHFSQTNPDGVFDIDDPNRRLFLFYCLRRLIRRNDQRDQDSILLLLCIPALKALLPTEVSPGLRNELLQLALSVGNQAAAAALLEIPAVRELAEENNYYYEEQAGGLDLRQIAQDHESSLIALTQGEQERLREVEQYYEPKLQEMGGVENCFTHLREALKERYRLNPASIKRGEEELILPLEWEDFVALSLLEEEKEEALRAYYQHVDHTALRYLSKPNRWMHKNAGYVHVDSERPEELWATFEEYKPLIALLYLAARDEEVPGEEGFTAESRFEQFIREIAFIGRAHNWKGIRTNYGRYVECDGGDGDRPSCFSGAKRRFFQSVPSHPLLAMLTKDKIMQEVNEFIRAHFETTINAANRKAVKTAWDNIIEGNDLSDEEFQILKNLDVCPAQQACFTRTMQQKYGKQFDKGFDRLVASQFHLANDKEAHILKFGYLHVDQFMQEPAPSAPRRVGLFTNAILSSEPPENNLNKLSFG